MNNELHALTSYIEMLMMNRPIYNNSEILKSVKIEIERLKEGLLFSFNQAQNKFQVSEYINGYYRNLIMLSDQLYERSKGHNTMAKQAMLKILSLMMYLRLNYGNFLEKNHDLAGFELFIIVQTTAIKAIMIKKLLIPKDVTGLLIDQIFKAFSDFSKPEKYGVIRSSDGQYITSLQQQLLGLVTDKRDKNWNLRLRLLLIRFNFNHLGIYKLLESEFEKQIYSIKSYKMQHQALYERKLWLEQIQVIPDVAYNRQAMSLKDLLMKHLVGLKEHLKEQRLIVETEQDKKLKHNLSVEEMALEFHYEYGEQVYDYKTKKAAAETFCSLSQSKARDEISLNSFLNFDKMNRNAAIKYYQRIGRIQKKLQEDFDL